MSFSVLGCIAFQDSFYLPCKDILTGLFEFSEVKFMGSLDEVYMRQALEFAERGAGFTAPNPMVGAVIVKDGRVIGEGWHERCGGPHAERNALANCTEDAAGATMYVTLEPCCHYGRTPPCTEAILEHKIARVVVGCLDPNEQVAGQGVRLLREQGVTVDVGVLEAECQRKNEVFMHYITTKRPFVVLKYAMTLDGKIAARTGDSRWVSGEASRRHVHETRKRLPAIMVGLGTVVTDDPLLTCRLPGEAVHHPTRVVCDSHLRMPLTAALVKTAKDVPTIAAYIDGDAEKAEQLRAAGVQLLQCRAKNGRLDLNDLMERLGAMQISGVLLEGGGALHWAALEAGIVQKVQVYIAPKLIGGAASKSPVGGEGFPYMRDAVPVVDSRLTMLGEDLLWEGYLQNGRHGICSRD